MNFDVNGVNIYNKILPKDINNIFPLASFIKVF